MSAYIIVDMTPKDADKLKEYAAGAAATLNKYKGEIILKSPIASLTGESHHPVKVIIQFADRDAATAWYHSPEYQAIIPLREEGMDAQFHLVG